MMTNRQQLQDLIRLLLLVGVGICGIHIAVSQDTADTGDVVIFRNGERLTGRVVSASTDSIIFDSTALGKLTISWERISQMKSSNRQSAILNEGATYGSAQNVEALSASHDELFRFVPDDQRLSLGGPISFSNTAAAVEQSSAPATSADSEKPGKTSVTLGVSAPESYVYGTQSQANLGGDVLLTRNQTAHVCDPPSWLSSLHVSGNHIRSWKAKSTAVTTNTYDGTLLEENAVSKNGTTAYYGIADLASNNSLGIGLQQSYGIGLSTIAYATECKSKPPLGHKLYVSIYGDVRYMHERLYAPASPLDLAGLRMGEDINYVFLNESKQPKFSISETIWVIPTVNDIHALQAFGALRFKVPITTSLSIGLNEEDDFLNNAPKGKRKNYSKSSVNVSYTFPASSTK